MAVTYVASGTPTSLSIAGTAPLPAGIQADDILLLFVESMNGGVTVPTGWTELTNSNQYADTGTNTTRTALFAAWRRADGSDTDPTINDTGNHSNSVIHAFRGCVTTGNPIDVETGGNTTTSSTSHTATSVTTTDDDRMVVVAFGTGANNLDSTTYFSGISNANLTSLTERTDYVSNLNNGGGFGVFTGEMASAGATGSTSVTYSTSEPSTWFTLALTPAASGGGGGTATIAEHASAPPVETGANGADLTTASFSPPAGTLLVAMAAGGYNQISNVNVTDSSDGATWLGVEQGDVGVAGVFYRYFASAPGSITVSANFSLTSGATNLVVKVLTGVDPIDPVGSTGARSRGDGELVHEDVTPTVVGSRVYCANSLDFCEAVVPNSVLSGTTVYSFHNQGVSVACAFGSTGASADLTLDTYGYDLLVADASSGQIVHLEVLPNPNPTVTGTAAATAPSAQVGITAEKTIDAELGVVAPAAGGQADGEVFTAGPLDVSAPVVQATATGSVQQNFLQAIAPFPSVTMTGEEEVIDATVSVTAPFVDVALTVDVRTAGPLVSTAPGATFDAEGELTAAGMLGMVGPAAALDATGHEYAIGPLTATAPFPTFTLGAETRIFGLRVTVVEQDPNSRVLAVPEDSPPGTFYV